MITAKEARFYTSIPNPIRRLVEDGSFLDKTIQKAISEDSSQVVIFVPSVPALNSLQGYELDELADVLRERFSFKVTLELKKAKRYMTISW